MLLLPLLLLLSLPGDADQAAAPAFSPNGHLYFPCSYLESLLMSKRPTSDQLTASVTISDTFHHHGQHPQGTPTTRDIFEISFGHDTLSARVLDKHVRILVKKDARLAHALMRSKTQGAHLDDDPVEDIRVSLDRQWSGCRVYVLISWGGNVSACELALMAMDDRYPHLSQEKQLELARSLDACRGVSFFALSTRPRGGEKRPKGGEGDQEAIPAEHEIQVLDILVLEALQMSRDGRSFDEMRGLWANLDRPIVVPCADAETEIAVDVDSFLE